MRVEDRMCLAKGLVVPSFIDVATGKRRPFSLRNNTLSYMSAEAMAAAFGGNPAYIPARMGFIYGTEGDMPTESIITRRQSWDALCEELYSSSPQATVDVQVVGFSYSPSLSAEKPTPGPDSDSSGSSGDSSSSEGGGSGDSGAGDYDNILSTGSNAITFHAVSNSQDRGAVNGTLEFAGGRYIYQAVLLGCHGGDYYIISRVSLKENGVYLQKPTGFEIALDWTIVFR